jgi:hypothetical protein
VTSSKNAIPKVIRKEIASRSWATTTLALSQLIFGYRAYKILKREIQTLSAAQIIALRQYASVKLATAVALYLFSLPAYFIFKFWTSIYLLDDWLFYFSVAGILMSCFALTFGLAFLTLRIYFRRF